MPGTTGTPTIANSGFAVAKSKRETHIFAANWRLGAMVNAVARMPWVPRAATRPMRHCSMNQGFGLGNGVRDSAGVRHRVPGCSQHETCTRPGSALLSAAMVTPRTQQLPHTSRWVCGGIAIKAEEICRLVLPDVRRSSGFWRGKCTYCYDSRTVVPLLKSAALPRSLPAPAALICSYSQTTKIGRVLSPHLMWESQHRARKGGGEPATPPQLKWTEGPLCRGRGVHIISCKVVATFCRSF